MTILGVWQGAHLGAGFAESPSHILAIAFQSLLCSDFFCKREGGCLPL